MLDLGRNPITGRLNVPRWLDAHGVKYREIRRGSTRLYHLGACPFNPQHTGTESTILQDETGRLGFKCQHNSCAEKHWADVRDAIGRPAAEHWDRVEGLAATNGAARGSKSPAFDLEPLSDAEFLARDWVVEWFVDDVLAQGQPLLIGGPHKALKTSIALDLLLSIASGTPFLGTFDIVHEAPVYIVSGELGGPVLRAAGDAIRRSRGIEGEPQRITWSFKSPQLSLAEHLTACRREIERTGSEIFMVDPAYLSLLSAHNAGDAGNLFSMGAVLRGFGQVGLDTGATLVLIHHFRKPSRGRRAEFEPPTLEDFSFSGFAEWARQWFLVARRSPFTPGVHRHELYLEISGTTGQSSAWSLDVNEGNPKDFVGRRWDLDLRPWVEVQADVRQAEAARKTAQRRETWESIKRVYRSAGPVSLSRLAEAAGGAKPTIEAAIAEFGPAEGFFLESGRRGKLRTKTLVRVDDLLA